MGSNYSLSILPRMIYPYFKDFHLIAQFYWRDDDFPAITRKMLGNIIRNDTTHDNLPDTTKNRCLESAVKMAELIQKYPDLVDTMLNWLNIYGD